MKSDGDRYRYQSRLDWLQGMSQEKLQDVSSWFVETIKKLMGHKNNISQGGELLEIACEKRAGVALALTTNEI